jgi:hypothetical protein
MAKRISDAEWRGDLKDGAGTLLPRVIGRPARSVLPIFLIFSSATIGLWEDRMRS